MPQSPTAIRTYRIYFRDASNVVGRSYEADLASDDDAREHTLMLLNEQTIYPYADPLGALNLAVMIDGLDCGATGYAVTSPPGVTMAMAPLCTSVTHIAPSGPAASAYGPPSNETLRAALTPA